MFCIAFHRRTIQLHKIHARFGFFYRTHEKSERITIINYSIHRSLLNLNDEWLIAYAIFCCQFSIFRFQIFTKRNESIHYRFKAIFHSTQFCTTSIIDIAKSLFWLGTKPFSNGKSKVLAMTNYLHFGSNEETIYIFTEFSQDAWRQGRHVIDTKSKWDTGSNNYSI